MYKYIYYLNVLLSFTGFEVYMYNMYFYMYMHTSCILIAIQRQNIIII